MDMHGHGETANSFDQTGKYEFNNLFLDYKYTADDVGTVLDYLINTRKEDLYFDHISAVGVSAGANIALICGYMYKEIKYISSIIGVINWDFILRGQTLDTFRFQAKSSMNYQLCRQTVTELNLSPLNRYNGTNLKRILFLTGMLDTTIPVIEAKNYYESMRQIYDQHGKGDYLKFQVYPRAGHEVTMQMVKDLLSWLDEKESVAKQ